MADFDSAKKLSLKSSIASAAGVAPEAVIVTITAGSVLITATIAVPASTTPAAMQTTLSSSLGTTVAANDLFANIGVTVTSAPAIVVAAPPPAAPPPALPPPKKDEDGVSVALIGGIVGGLGGACLLAAMVCGIIYLKKKKNIVHASDAE